MSACVIRAHNGARTLSNGRVIKIRDRQAPKEF